MLEKCIKEIKSRTRTQKEIASDIGISQFTLNRVIHNQKAGPRVMKKLIDWLQKIE